MAMPAIVLRTDWTVDDLESLPQDGSRYEIIDGELLVSPSPRVRHQWAAAKLYDQLRSFVEPARIGYLFSSPVNVEYGPRTHLEPDMSVVPAVLGKLPETVEAAGGPLLVIEILSPSTARYDRVKKRPVYQRQGVEYWIVDIDARVIERWMPDDTRPEIASETLVWAPKGCEAPFSLDVAAYFRAVHEE